MQHRDITAEHKLAPRRRPGFLGIIVLLLVPIGFAAVVLGLAHVTGHGDPATASAPAAPVHPAASALSRIPGDSMPPEQVVHTESNPASTPTGDALWIDQLVRLHHVPAAAD